MATTVPSERYRDQLEELIAGAGESSDPGLTPQNRSA